MYFSLFIHLHGIEVEAEYSAMVISEYDMVPLFLLIVEFSLQKLSVCTECPA